MLIAFSFQLIDFHQHKSRALDFFFNAQCSRQPLHKGRLSRTQIPLQSDQPSAEAGKTQNSFCYKGSRFFGPLWTSGTKSHKPSLAAFPLKKNRKKFRI